jgi:hypothetical protein
MSETGSSSFKSLSPSEASTAETRNEVERSQEWHYDYSTVVGFFSQDVARPILGKLDAVCAACLRKCLECYLTIFTVTDGRGFRPDRAKI